MLAMPFTPLELRDIFADKKQSDSAIAARLGLNNIADQNTVSLVIGLARASEHILHSLDEIKKLHATTRSTVGALAKDVTEFATNTYNSRPQIGTTQLSAREQAEKMVYGDNPDAGAFFRTGDKDKIEKDIGYLTTVISMMDKASDRALTQDLISNVRTKVVREFFKENVEDCEDPFRMTVPAETLHPDLRRAQATALLALYYEDNEKTAIRQEAEDRYMKVPDFVVQGIGYADGFSRIAGETYDVAAGFLLSLGEVKLAETMMQIAQNFMMPDHIVLDKTPHALANALIKSQKTLVGEVNKELKRPTSSQVEISEDYVATLQSLGVLTEAPVPLLGTGVPLKNVPV